jgi:hypothetical protein
MKSKLNLFLMFWFIAISSYSQTDSIPKIKSCPSFGVMICNQSEIDSFPYRYSHCGELVGGILISGDDIVNLKGLSFLTAIWGDLTIMNNPFLRSLDGLENLMPGTISNLTITGNTVLSSCDLRGICNYLASPNGSVTIQANAPGCDSYDKMKTYCGILNKDNLELPDEFCIFPNPSSGRLTTRFYLKNPVSVSLIIINCIGQPVATMAHEVLRPGMHEILWDASGLPRGLYYCQVIAGKSIRTEKIIIEK